ncbi:hypothetical protein KGO04_01205 [Patescibacteria group bacterium]|nr:hypothetical protein [Patescibacteria group bacterium]MDE1944032.1 hypothetical protein [Patescibacteria group bacterium]MDE1945551.1 hypothetical protein [Patescibacteria group bacterium]
MSPKPAATKKHERSVEKLSHFRCAHCGKWWSVGDAPLAKKVWWCPWCGLSAQTINAATH